MAHILEGLVLINGADIWKEFGAFLAEEKRGGKDNLTAILTPSKAKGHVAVDFREVNGEKYPTRLIVANEARDVQLNFALFAESRQEWLTKYKRFISFLKTGQNGWLSVNFTELGLTLRLFYQDSTTFKPLTYIWKEGYHAGSFKVKFREPEPII